ncbi:MAG: DNA mismatch repair protein MutS, partial [Alphaproteobacteria bacterium]
MMAQYLEIKQAYPDCLLFFRMGDFYEMFFDDAVVASEALGIALTRRGKHEGEDVAMCGVPVHAVDGYLARLIKASFRVAVCEQMEDPAEARRRGPKAPVKREVVRVVTPGTLTEESLLDARRHNYLAAVASAEGTLSLAWLDISTGEFLLQPVLPQGLASALARLQPGEILVPERLLEREELFETYAQWKQVLRPLPSSKFDSESGRARLERLYQVKALVAFGDFGRADVAAAGALVDYVELTQKGRVPRLARPKRQSPGESMEIDQATRRNLELAESLSGERSGSLLAVIDRTVTAAGGRLLLGHLAAPLTDPGAIAGRLDMVGFFVEDAERRRRLRDQLKRAPDIERALARLMVGRGGPRDLAAIGDGLERGDRLRGALAADGLGAPPGGVSRCLTNLGQHDALVDRLGRALAAELPQLARDGGFIAAGYHPGLDEQRVLRDEGRRLVAGLQGRYAAETGIPSLKIRHNNVLGYFVEATSAQAGKVPRDTFILRQSMANAARYTTVELGELEDKIGRAADKALALELQLFDDLVGEVAARAEAIQRAARALAALDVAAGLAELAVERRYTRPVV